MKFDNKIDLPYKIYVYELKNDQVSIKCFNEDTRTNYSSEMSFKILEKITKKAINTNAWNTDKSVGITLKAKLIFDDKKKKKDNNRVVSAHPRDIKSEISKAEVV